MTELQLETDRYTLKLEESRFELTKKKDDENDTDSWIYTRRGDAVAARLVVRSHPGHVSLEFNGGEIGDIDKADRPAVEALHKFVFHWIDNVGPLDGQTARIVQLLYYEAELRSQTSISVQAITWNVNGRLATTTADTWKFVDKTNDVLIFGFQETDELKRNLVSNQQTLAHVTSTLDSMLPGFKLVSHVQLLGLMSLVYARDKLIPFVSPVTHLSSGTGFLRVWGNKGAVLTKFTLFHDDILGGGTEFAIVDCHLSAGEGSSQTGRRRWELREISTKFKIPNLSMEIKEGDMEIAAADYADLSDSVSSLSDDEPARYRHVPSQADKTESKTLSVDSMEESVMDSPGNLSEESLGSPQDSQALELPLQADGGSASIDSETPEIVGEPDTYESQGATNMTIVMGDLNYRVLLDGAKAKSLIQGRHYGSVLQKDSLKQEMEAGYVLRGFKEGEIGFPPTFKYGLGTNHYVTRVPSYTDRILYRGTCEAKMGAYQSFDDRSSDHRPVGATMNLSVDCIDQKDRTKYIDQALRAVDRAENKARPRMSADPQATEVAGSVLSTVSAWLVLHSDSNRTVRWSVQSGTRVQVTPDHGVLPVGQQTARVLVKTHLKVGDTKISDVVVVSPQGGSDVFVSVDFDAYKSCLGSSLQEMCHMPDGARGPRSEEATTNLPKQIWACVNYLWTRIDPLMFSEPGTAGLVQQILEWLDTGKELDAEVLDKANASSRSGTCAVANVLRLIFAYLPEKPIPAVDLEPGPNALNVLETIPSSSANVVIYVLGFFRHAFDYGFDRTEAIDLLQGWLLGPENNDAKVRCAFVASLLA